MVSCPLSKSEETGSYFFETETVTGDSYKKNASVWCISQTLWVPKRYNFSIGWCSFSFSRYVASVFRQKVLRMLDSQGRSDFLASSLTGFDAIWLFPMGISKRYCITWTSRRYLTAKALRQAEIWNHYRRYFENSVQEQEKSVMIFIKKKRWPLRTYHKLKKDLVLIPKNMHH